MSRHEKPIIAIQQLAQMVGEMEAELDVTRGALAANGLSFIEVPKWAAKLTRQQRELMGVLLRAAPKAVERWDIMDCLTPLDHAKDRNAQLVTVLVGRIRAILGADAIETVPSGYKLSDEFRARMIREG